MKTITYSKHPTVWRHGNWQRTQLRYFGGIPRIRREKNIEDFIINNGIQKIHLIKDNTVLDQFVKQTNLELVDPNSADLVVITDQRFSRLDTLVIIDYLKHLLELCPRIYFCLNRYYLNANESSVDPRLPEVFDAAIVTWLQDNLPGTVVFNRSEIFNEDGSCFTWVVPSCELLLCKI